MKNSPFFPKSCRSSFYLKVLFSKVAPNVTNTFGLYCMQNCGQDFSKGGPIWSRCLAFVNFLAYIWSSRAIWLLWSTFRRQKLCQKLFFGNVKRATKSRCRSVVKSCEKLLCSTRCNPDNGHHWGMDHCTAGVQFDKTGLDQQKKIWGYLYVWKQLNLNQS